MSALMLDGDHEQWVINLIAKKTGLSPTEISPESRLLHDLGITGDDAVELLSEYSEAFQVDMGEFEFRQYFTGEPHLFNCWFAAKGSKLRPLTVRDLAEAARQKKWIRRLLSALPDPKHDL